MEIYEVKEKVELPELGNYGEIMADDYDGQERAQAVAHVATSLEHMCEFDMHDVVAHLNRDTRIRLHEAMRSVIADELDDIKSTLNY